MLRFLLLLLAVATLAGCSTGGSVLQSSVFARPAVVYRTGDNLEISYFNAGIQQSFNEAAAIDLLKKECGGAFRITGRTASPSGDAYIDAVCVH